MKALVLYDMIWPEVAEALDKIEIALIPTGSCEQHGPNLTFETDTARAYSFAKMIGERMGERALVCPPVGYGISPHHMPFPGTITLRSETFINILVDIVLSLNKHGIKKFAFLNGHGGNNTSLDVTVNLLKHQYDIDALFTPIGGKIYHDAIKPEWGWSSRTGHACEAEGSQGMALCPWIVRKDCKPGEMVDNKLNDLLRVSGGSYGWNWKTDFSNNGALGDARNINLEYGTICNNLALDRVQEIIEEFLKLKKD